MRFLLLIFLLRFSLYSPAQRPDVDALTRELDLSILREENGEEPETPLRPPPHHVFVDFDRLPAVAPAAEWLESFQNGNLYLLRLPAASYLVAPNPPRVDTSYAALALALQELDLQARFPVKLVLHADGNFSVAVALAEPPDRPLPLGIDLSPLPALEFAAVEADIQLLDKTHPPVLDAYLRLQSLARSQGWTLDRKEFYFFPQSPGKVWFALRVQTPEDDPASATKE
ncbi:MAG: hypothetical protein ACO3N7_05725 [Kiritimatiellia bacterium]